MAMSRRLELRRTCQSCGYRPAFLEMPLKNPASSCPLFGQCVQKLPLAVPKVSLLLPCPTGVPRAPAKLLLHATSLRCSIAIAKGRCHGIGYEDTGRAGLEWRKKHNVLKPWPFGRTMPTKLTLAVMAGLLLP